MTSKDGFLSSDKKAKVREEEEGGEGEGWRRESWITPLLPWGSVIISEDEINVLFKHTPLPYTLTQVTYRRSRPWAFLHKSPTE